jgi:hypothetical protein
MKLFQGLMFVIVWVVVVSAREREEQEGGFLIF